MVRFLRFNYVMAVPEDGTPSSIYKELRCLTPVNNPKPGNGFPGKVSNGDNSPRPEAITARALQLMEFPPISYVVPGHVVEGLTLLASKPKVGKSWLALH
jgi:hypothetical protein